MAQTETLNIVRIDTGKAVENVGQLRDYISDLKQKINDTNSTFEENAKITEELRKAQNDLRGSMHATATSADDLIASSKELFTDNEMLNGSYNDLVNVMGEMKRAWRATTDEVERAKLGSEIDRVNGQLKKMDAGVGTFSRNVGNYTGGIADFFDKFKGGSKALDNMINPLQGVNSGLAVMSKTPVIGILGLLATILQKVIDNLHSSEENTNRLSVALAPLKAGTTLLTKVMQGLGSAIASVAEWLTKVLDKWGLLSDKMLEHQEITKEEIALQKERRQVEMDNADAQLAISKLKAQASEKDKYTAKERLDFIQQAADKEKEIADRNIAIARREYEVLKRKSELAGNSKEENDELADAYVTLTNAETDYFNKMRELNAQRVEAINQIKAETRANKDLAASKEEVISADILNDTFEEEDIWASYEKQKAKSDAENEAFWQGLVEKENLRQEYLANLEKAEDEETAIVKAAEEERMKARIESMQMVANTTSTILNSIADLFEANAKDEEKAAKQVKAIRIAAATIDTISGAVKAFMAAGNPVKGAIDAAVVTAAGIDQIAKIRATDISRSGSSNPSLSSPVVSAPVVNNEPDAVRTITAASEEEKLNAPQRVYILSSDIEASQNAAKVQVDETSF